jgi:hypothetical protein
MNAPPAVPGAEIIGLGEGDTDRTPGVWKSRSIRPKKIDLRFGEASVHMNRPHSAGGVAMMHRFYHAERKTARAVARVADAPAWFLPLSSLLLLLALRLIGPWAS